MVAALFLRRKTRNNAVIQIKNINVINPRAPKSIPRIINEDAPGYVV